MERHDACSSVLGVGYALQEIGCVAVGGDHEVGLVAVGSGHVVDAEAQVLGCILGNAPAQQGRGEIPPSVEASLLVEMSREVPGLELGSTHDEQAAGRLRALAQRARKAAGVSAQTAKLFQPAAHVVRSDVHTISIVTTAVPLE